MKRNELILFSGFYVAFAFMVMAMLVPIITGIIDIATNFGAYWDSYVVMLYDNPSQTLFLTGVVIGLFWTVICVIIGSLLEGDL